MTRAQATASRLRWIILVAGICYTTIALTWLILPFFEDALFKGFFPAGLMGTPLIPGRLVELSDWRYGTNVGLVLGLLLIAQWAFLRPRTGWAVHVATVARPLRSSIIVAGLMASLLTIGALAMVLELPNWWEKIMGGSDQQAIGGGWGFIGVWAAILVAWGIWAWIFFVYWRQGDRYTQMGKMIRALVAGSMLEVFVAIPVHVWAARQRECYCCRGTYTTIILAGVVLLWVFGPGIVLLFMREKYRREKLLWGEPYACPKCGYDQRGTISAETTTCPECGAIIGREVDAVPRDNESRKLR